jgi:hypothetical protein
VSKFTKVSKLLANSISHKMMKEMVRYLKLHSKTSKEGKQLQSNYMCYMKVKLEWEKEEDVNSCVCVCVCVGGGGRLVRAATFGIESERNNTKKLKICIYTYVVTIGRAV